MLAILSTHFGSIFLVELHYFQFLEQIHFLGVVMLRIFMIIISAIMNHSIY